MSDEIVIAGAGIAGLTAALALSHFGRKSTIVESFKEPAEIGAGIQVPPNASRVLASLGLLQKLEAVASRPKSVALVDALSGKVLLDLPVAAQYDAPHLTVLRAGLHNVLYTAALADENISFLTNHTILSAQNTGDGAALTCVLGNGDLVTINASLLVGADGVWSPVRSAVHDALNAKRTGRLALRAIVATDDVKREPRVSAFLAPDCHMVAYPTRNAETVNLVAILPVRNAHPGSLDEDWSNAISVRGVDDLVRTMAKSPFAHSIETANWRAWPLASVPADSAWHDGNICLIGDAAHALEPFAAQGAAMAMEDAFVLARQISANTSPAEASAAEAFAAYDRLRRPRVAKVAARTAFNRKVYHLGGPLRTARNTAFALRPASSFMRDLDWLYSYDPTK